MAVDHGELRAIRMHVAQTMHDTGGDIPDGLVPPLETIFPEVSTWESRLDSKFDMRRLARPLGQGAALRMTALVSDKGAANLRRLQAMFQGIRSYITDMAVERAILSDRYGPVGVWAFEKEPSDWPFNEVGPANDPSTSQGAILGYLMGEAIGSEAARMCRDEATSPLTDRALTQFALLSSFFGQRHVQEHEGVAGPFV
jgi:hypothetical protein